jgi:CubicO group peptidase (beta-lactamase class C family)
MPAEHFFAEDPREVGLDPAKVEALFIRAEREIKDGILPSSQIAIARKGKIAAMRTVGRAVQGGADKPATNETLYCIFSCTKAIMSSAVWLLMQDGKLDPSERVADIVPEFAPNGKDQITIEQVLLHVSGFPNAPFNPLDWPDRKKRLERFSQWRLEFPVGAKFFYHPTAGFWIIAEIIERKTGQDFRQFIRNRIAMPLGIPDLRVGLPRELTSRAADIVYLNEPLTAEEKKKIGFPDIDPGEVNEENIMRFNIPELREVGVPGGGGVTTAGDLALFYQALIGDGRSYDGKQIWKTETLREALRVRSGDYVDHVFGFRCNRALGVSVAGDDGQANIRGFGKTASPRAFGHGGAGGQIGWGDPATGISIGYCTNGFDRNEYRQARRGVAISSLAGVCAG